MSIISNNSILQNPLSKKAFSKISFEVGENFNARIVSTDEQKGEVNLKLLDGWQFAAKLDKSLEQTMDGGVLKFEVEGFEDGKLIIKLVDDNNNNNNKNTIVENDTLEDFFHGKLVGDGRDDALIFEKMIKHDMPLTKENIIDIKSLLDFKEKISLDTNKEDVFIDKYLNSRKVDASSEKADEIAKNLKTFFQALKDLNVDEILLFKENNIQLTKGNLESFIKLFKENSAVYNNLKEISNYLLNSDIINVENIKSKGEFQGKAFTEIELIANLESIKDNQETHSSKFQKNTVSEMDNKNIINSKANGYGKNNSINEIINMIKKELNISEIDKGIIDNDYKEIQKITTDVLIKDQIKLKTQEIRNMVKEIIENKINLKPEIYEKVMNVFEQKMNDFKIFNSISQQYYYLDLPININEDEYELKLIIKDDRKKSKNIDSKNVQIATSIKTINMGTVDAYIKIKNNNMNIDINCNKFFVKVLELSKDQLFKDLSSLSYKVSIKINNKLREFSLTSCGEFFDDRSFNNINIKV